MGDANSQRVAKSQHASGLPISAARVELHGPACLSRRIPPCRAGVMNHEEAADSRGRSAGGQARAVVGIAGLVAARLRPIVPVRRRQACCDGAEPYATPGVYSSPGTITPAPRLVPRKWSLDRRIPGRRLHAGPVAASAVRRIAAGDAARLIVHRERAGLRTSQSARPRGGHSDAAAATADYDRPHNRTA